jgi:hypothetical protein
LAAGPAQEPVAKAQQPDPPEAAYRPPKLVSDKERAKAFAAYCTEQGLALRHDDSESAGDAEGYSVMTPAVRDFDVIVSFLAFAPGTTTAEMRKGAWTYQLPFPFANERAGLEMSMLQFRVRAAVPDDYERRVLATQAQLVQLFRDYSSTASAGRKEASATQGGASEKQEANAAAFTQHCEQHGVKLSWDGAADSYYREAAPDFDLLICFRAFAPPTSADEMAKAIHGDCVVSPAHFNDKAALAMSQVGLRAKGVMSATVCEHASAEIAKLVRLFDDFRPSEGTGDSMRPKEERSAAPSTGVQ